MSGEAAVSEEQPTAPREGVGSYIYGIVLAGTAVPEGLEPIPTETEAGLGLVTVGALSAIVSDIRTDRRLGTRKDLLAHEQVLNAVAGESSVLPMRFGAVVRDDRAVADELLAPHEDYFVRALGEIDGLTQFILRGRYDQDAVLSRMLADDPQIQQLREKVAGVDEDASYYDRIALGEAISHSMDRLRASDVDATLEDLGRFAVATSVKEAGSDEDAVNVAFLVRRDHRTDFERAVDDLGDRWDGRVNLRLVGPTAIFDFLPEYDAPATDEG